MYYLKVVATPTAINKQEAKVWYYGNRRHFTEEKPEKGWVKLFGYNSITGARRGASAHQSNELWDVSVFIECIDV